MTAEPVAAGKVGQEVSVRAGHLVLDQRPCFGDPVDLASCEMLHQLCLIFKIAQIYPVDRRLSPDIATISPFSSEKSKLSLFHPAQAVIARPDRISAQAGSIILYSLTWIDYQIGRGQLPQELIIWQVQLDHHRFGTDCLYALNSFQDTLTRIK